MPDEPPPGSEEPLPPEHSLPSYGEPTPETHRSMSREDEAELALRATTFTPYTRALFISLFLATISVALLWDPLAAGRVLAGLLRGGHLPRPAELKTAQKTIEQESALSQWLLPRVQLPLTAWLGAGNEQAYCGQDGWLFYRPDVEHLTGPPFLAKNRASIDAILDFHAQLQARGIVLIVLPAPVKPSVEGQRLSRASGTRQILQNPSFAEWASRLRQAGVTVFDPLTELGPRLGQPGPLYLKSDTHWRPETMEFLATRLADAITAQKLLPTTPPATYRAAEQTIANRGDIAAMLKLPATQRLYPPQTVSIHPVQSGEGLWRPTRRADVLLLGDSFSNIYSLDALGWGEAAGLAEHLSLALHRPLDCILRNSDGAYATRAILSRELAAGSDRLAGKKLVIWEFATRELSFGAWKRLSLALGEAKESRFYTPPAGRPVTVSGTVQAISAAPRPGSVPYAEHLVTAHLVDLAGADLPPGQSAQALVCLASMREHVWTRAARLRPGDRVTLRLRPWSEVSAQNEKINRSDLDDPALQLEEPAWAEFVP